MTYYIAMGIGVAVSLAFVFCPLRGELCSKPDFQIRVQSVLYAVGGVCCD